LKVTQVLIQISFFVADKLPFGEDAITNDPSIPMLEKDKIFSEKPWSQWTKSERKKV